MVTLNAHFDGKTIVFDEPLSLPLPSGARLRISVETIEDQKQPTVNGQHFRPLDIHIDGELAKAIAIDPEFNIEES